MTLPLKVKQISSLYFRSRSDFFLTDSHASDSANLVFSEILPAKRDRVDDNAGVNLDSSQSIRVEAQHFRNWGTRTKRAGSPPSAASNLNELLQRLVPTQRHCVE